MKTLIISVAILFLTTLLYSQNDLENGSYNSQSGLTFSFAAEGEYGVGYNFVLNSHSTISATLFYMRDKDNEKQKWGYSKLTTGEYTEWNDLYSLNEYGLSVYYLHDFIKFSSSKFYLGAGSKIAFGESEGKYSRELKLTNLNQQGSMSENSDTRRISLDFLLGYEHKLADFIKIFGEFDYSLKWYNYETTVINGWVRSMNIDSNIENTGLSPVKNDSYKSSKTKKEFEIKLGFIFSF